MEKSDLLEKVIDKFSIEIGEISKFLLEEVTKQAIREDNKYNEKREKLYQTIADMPLQFKYKKQKPILIVVPTPKSEQEYKETNEYWILNNFINQNVVQESEERIYSTVEVDIVASNKEGLSKVYNRYLHEDYKDYYVLFIHDDVEIQDTHFVEKLINSHKLYDVVGVAGATNIFLPIDKKTPTAWHLLSRQHKDVFDSKGTLIKKETDKKQSGYVIHQHQGKTFATNFGVAPQECKLLDGLFMSFNIEKCLEHNFTFDEDFQFHHYDLSACIKATQCNLKMGTAPITVLHKGIGDSMQSSEWVQSHVKFVDKYAGFLNKKNK